jgi:hypothetical protein
LCLALSTLAAACLAPSARAAAPPPVIKNGPAFVAKFDNPKLPDWLTNGAFSVKDGKLTVGDPNNNRQNTFVFAKPVINVKDGTYTVYTNFTVEMRARLISDPKDWGGFGIWFRANGASQYRDGDWNPTGGAGYCFNYVPGLKAVTLVRRPHSMNIGGDPKPAPIDQNVHDFRVDAIGPHIVAFFDGAKVFDAVQPEKPFGYTNGSVGIGVFNRGAVEVESFTITPH